MENLAPSASEFRLQGRNLLHIPTGFEVPPSGIVDKLFGAEGGRVLQAENGCYLKNDVVLFALSQHANTQGLDAFAAGREGDGGLPLAK